MDERLAPGAALAAATASSSPHFYPVGTAGKAWGDAERAQWLALVGTPQRSYADEVLAALEPLKERFDVEQYGALSMDAARYPLFCVKTRGFDAANGKPCVLVTGGVHGYEASGVQGALLFCAEALQRYAGRFNVVVCPCVSPWGYECVQRWSAAAVDPNRSIRGAAAECPTEETAALVALVLSLGARGPWHGGGGGVAVGAGGGGGSWIMHLDCHETTDSDLTEFQPARSSRDGEATADDEGIPDGFYLVGDAANAQPAWHAAIIQAVRAVTHIAPPDAEGSICDVPVVAEGVINVPVQALNLCASVTGATFATTTEVYPDSKVAQVTAAQCNRAQVAAVTAGLDYIVAAMGPVAATGQ
jgi:hypothetical protein